MIHFDTNITMPIFMIDASPSAEDLSPGPGLTPRVRSGGTTRVIVDAVEHLRDWAGARCALTWRGPERAIDPGPTPRIQRIAYMQAWSRVDGPEPWAVRAEAQVQMITHRGARRWSGIGLGEIFISHPDQSDVIRGTGFLVGHLVANLAPFMMERQSLGQSAPTWDELFLGAERSA